MSEYKSLSHALPNMLTHSEESVLELSYAQPVLLIFLRHFGCTFCRETIKEIADRRAPLEVRGIKPILVHMCDAPIAQRYFDDHGLTDILHVCDLTCAFYKAFGLSKGNFNQLFGLQSWIRGFEAGILKGHGVGYRQLGDGFQMPGAFVLREGRVISKFIHELASDKPNYESMIRCCT